MLFVIIPLSIALLGLIVYYALSPRSSKTLRLSAFGALVCIMLSVVICTIIIFANLGGNDEPVMPDFFAAEPPNAAPENNFFILVLFAVFLLILLGIVILLAVRERRIRGKI
ncbi:MAG: hypothetical protein LBI94_00585 [Treponema sp.]|jgi:uncharacterized membrane protein YhaH (DUF805 family)|nr:hypothetical protein [Treponema sp.]